MTKYNGKCSCAQVRYTLKDDPIFTHACHCTLCQRYTASAFIVHSLMETSNFTLIKGSLSETVGPSGSGKGFLKDFHIIFVNNSPRRTVAGTISFSNSL